MNGAVFKQGDIFDIPAGEAGRGYGQVIVDGAPLYVVIFKHLFVDRPSIDQIVRSEPLLVGWTLDALLFHGRWSVVGNGAIAHVPFPSYKVRKNGIPYVRDFSGRNYRQATEREWELLEHKTTVAPMRFQKAFLAYHSLLPWIADYDQLTIQHARRRVLGDVSDDS